MPANRLQSVLAGICISSIVFEHVPLDYKQYDGILDCGHVRSVLDIEAIHYFADKKRYYLHIQNPIIYDAEKYFARIATAVFSVFNIPGFIHIGHLINDQPRQYSNEHVLSKILYLGTGRNITGINNFVFQALANIDDIEVLFCYRQSRPIYESDNIKLTKSIDDAYSAMRDYDIVVGGLGSGLVNECLNLNQVSILLPVASSAEYLKRLASYYQESGGCYLSPTSRNRFMSLIKSFQNEGELRHASLGLRDKNKVLNAHDILSHTLRNTPN